MNLNPHHLELFYFVARNEGVRQAARQMPYGIGPSAISRQLTLFERQMGVSLCERYPFKLTLAGEKLFAFLQPIFDDLPVLIDELQGKAPALVRLGASPVVLREYMPSMVGSLRRNFPDLRFTLSEGLQGQIEDWLKEKKIDLAVTLLDEKPPANCLSEPLLRLPMILLAPSRSKVRCADALWRRGRVAELLICPIPQSAISKGFLDELRRREIEWPVGIEANSIELIEAYVKNGLGIGLSLAAPERRVPRGLRALPLPDFPKVELGMIWQRNPSAATQALMRELRREAKRLALRK